MVVVFSETVGSVVEPVSAAAGAAEAVAVALGAVPVRLSADLVARAQAAGGSCPWR